MRDLPVRLDGYRLRVVDPPCPKMKEGPGGVPEPVLDRNGVQQFVVALFGKLRVAPGERAPKGEEFKVTLETDPGEGFDEGAPVELINPRVSLYQIDQGEGRVLAGLSFKAMGIKLGVGRADK